MFAVHFDKPRKFYIGCLEYSFCSDQGLEIDQASFKFLDFKGNGHYYMKPNTAIEIVPARNVFYGPIIYEPIKNAGYLLSAKSCDEINSDWNRFNLMINQ